MSPFSLVVLPAATSLMYRISCVSRGHSLAIYLISYLAYPCWISRSIISVKVVTTIYDTLYYSASLRISRYPEILQGEVLHRWILCACRIPIQIEHKRHQQSTPEAMKSSPSAAASGGEARGSGRSSVRVVPFQSLPSSTQEELGKELFDDPLLTVENIQKLADYMQWSFKFTKVCLLLSSVFLYQVVLISDLSFLVL